MKCEEVDLVAKLHIQSSSAKALYQGNDWVLHEPSADLAEGVPMDGFKLALQELWQNFKISTGVQQFRYFGVI